MPAVQIAVVCMSFLTFSFLNKTIETLASLPSQSLRPYDASPPSPSDSIYLPLSSVHWFRPIFSFGNCSGVKSLILSHQTLVKTTHRRHPPSITTHREDKMRCHEVM
ncbi:hypothetical protein QL285_020176 [Trifolium repens]|nr:hypothetical protein QL285_020176 [Trifolium repens]